MAVLVSSNEKSWMHQNTQGNSKPFVAQTSCSFRPTSHQCQIIDGTKLPIGNMSELVEDANHDISEYTHEDCGLEYLSKVASC